LLALGPRTVLLKLGAAGCLCRGSAGDAQADPFTVTPVDTTAAGDIFNAALAVALAEGMAISAALRFANAAAAVSVTRRGAQNSAPTRADANRMQS